MTICRVSLLIIGQIDINPKLLQPIVASIRKFMAVKKLCVISDNGVLLIGQWNFLKFVKKVIFTPFYPF